MDEPRFQPPKACLKFISQFNILFCVSEMDAAEFYSAMVEAPQGVVAALADRERRSEATGGHDCASPDQGRCLRLFGLRGHGLGGHDPSETRGDDWGYGY